MRYGVAMVTVVAWGLWFGGLGALFLFVSYLFVSDRRIAIEAAPKMFAVFETYQLFVAAIGLVSAATWRLISPGRASITFIFAMMALAAVGVIGSALAIRPPMERMRIEGQSSSPQFQRLHKISERVYSAQALALLAAGVVIPVALSPRKMTTRVPIERPQIETEAAEPTTPPGEPVDRVV